MASNNDSNGNSLIKDTGINIAERTTRKLRRKLEKKLVQWTWRICTTIAGFFSGIIMPVIALLLITIIIVNTFLSFFNTEQYKQESPELVRLFLDENYEKFENKVRILCDEPDFLAFVANSEFDNAYTKLVYGGTNAYTQEELKGNAEGVQGKSADWVSGEEGNYTATSVLEKIQSYLDMGVSAGRIKIRDEYLQGYTESSGYGTNETLIFANWINYSYYNIPYYYHWNMAQNSAYKAPFTILGSNVSGDDTGLPAWNQDNLFYLWNFMLSAKNQQGEVLFQDNLMDKISGSSGVLKDTSYKEYLDIDFTSTKKAQGVMMGYSQEWIDESDWLTKGLNKFSGKDQNVAYKAFSKLAIKKDRAHQTESNYSDIIRNLYVYDWFEKKTDGKTNFETYLSKPKNTEILGKRENANHISKVNTEVTKWKSQFAEYFAKEIYYVYPNRDYIVDYFLSDEVEKSKKIAFLQRSFYAMATGASLDVKIKESYAITNGQMGSNMSENHTGSLNINDISIENLTLKGYVPDGRRITETTNQDEIEAEVASRQQQVENEDVPEIAIIILYDANVKITYSDNSTETLHMPVSNMIQYDKRGAYNNELIFNSDYGDYVDKDKLSETANNHYTWDDTYYEDQYDYEDDSSERNENPLDGLKIKCNGFKNQTWNINFTEISTEDLYQKLKSYYTSTNKNALLKMFDGSMEGKRSIHFQYSDHSFLNYDVNETKDSNGNITGVNIEIYTYYPDLSVYDEGTYRVAYGFETSGAINEAFNLLQYAKEHKGETGKLTGLRDAVDFSQLIIGEDSGYAQEGYIFGDEDLATFIVGILAEVESSNDWGCTIPATTGAEKTITVGAYQEYGERAHTLLRNICTKYKNEAISILGQALYNRCIDSTDWEATSAYFSSDELSKISKLISTDYGIAMQKEKMAGELSTYLNVAASKGITDNRCVAYFCVMYHQSPKRSYEVTNAWLNSYANELEANSSTDCLDRMYKYCMNNPVLGIYINRYNTTYEKCKNLSNVHTTGMPKDVTGVLQYAMSNKVIGKPYGRSSGSTKFLPSYDCSQFVWCAWYYGGGINFGSSTSQGVTAASELQWCEQHAQMVCSGTADLSKMQAGDIIFFTGNAERYKSIGHVALYIGNNKVIEAGSPVGEYTLGNRSSFHSVYRIVTSKKKSEKETKK